MLKNQIKNYAVLCWPLFVGSVGGMLFFIVILGLITLRSFLFDAGTTEICPLTRTDPGFLAIVSIGFWQLMGLWYFLKGHWALLAAARAHGGIDRVLGCERQEFERLLAEQHRDRRRHRTRGK